MPQLLDNLKLIKKLDRSNQAQLLIDFPKHLEAGWWEANAIELPRAYHTTKEVILCGMGGSAIGADIVSTLPKDYAKQPLHVIRGYDLPSWINESTLVIVISYSGNTEETLSCFHQAVAKKAKIFTLSKDGELAELAHKHNVPYYRIPDTIIPRASLGYQAASLINVLTRTHKIHDAVNNLQRPISLLSKLNDELAPAVPTKQNPAKLLATFLYGRIPLIIGSGILEPVARRFKDQINENAKTFAVFETAPELSHNVTEGLQFPQTLKKQLGVILLENDFDHPQITKHFSMLKKLLTKLDIRYRALPSVGSDMWSQKISSILISDWTSFYLAILNGVDPSPVPIIEWTKKQLL